MNIIAFVLSLLFGGGYLIEAFIEIKSGASVGFPDIVLIIACVLFVLGGYMALKRKEKAPNVLALSIGVFILSYFLIPEGSARLGNIDKDFVGGDAVLVVITAIIAYIDKRRFAVKQTKNESKKDTSQQTMETEIEKISLPQLVLKYVKNRSYYDRKNSNGSVAKDIIVTITPSDIDEISGGGVMLTIQKNYENVCVVNVDFMADSEYPYFVDDFKDKFLEENADEVDVKCNVNALGGVSTNEVHFVFTKCRVL